MATAASSLRGSPLASNGLSYDSGSTRATRYSTRLFQQQQQQQQAPRCTLELEEVIGNTVTNPNGFDSLSDGTFAVCSGSTAVVNNILPSQTTKQRVFRAPTKPTAETIPTIESAPTTPTRTRGRQTPRASILAPGSGTSDLKDIFSKIAVHKKPKGTSCLALSPNGVFLAVGETGYAPRILLFSLVSGLNTPVSIATEHGSGVQTLCFSPDSKWLCSVGDIYDGSIHLWQITARGALKLSATSRCTSIVHETKWINDRSFVTAGVRHLKIWRPDIPDQASSPPKSTNTPRMRLRQDSPIPSSPSLKSLSGRNVLLNDLLESTFTSLFPVEDSKALVASDSGDLSIFSVTKGTQRLSSIANLGAPIGCVTFHVGENVILAATNTDIWAGSLSTSTTESKWHAITFIRAFHLTCPVLAFGFVTDTQLFCIDERRRASIYQMQIHEQQHRIFDLQHEKTYPSHSAAVTGSVLQMENSRSSLLTYDASGQIVAWDSDVVEHDISVQASLSLYGDDPNELKIVRQVVNSCSTICGDKHGSITVLDAKWLLCDRVQAHSGEVNDIAIIELPDLETLIVTCGRDRVVQVYSLSALELALLQTLDHHNGSVNKLEVVEQSTTLLLSLSSDRTIAIHALCKLETSQAFLCIRTITLKSTPLSCALDLTNTSNLAVSTADKQLQIFQLSSGLLESSTRIVDGDDQIAIQHMQVQTTVVDDKPTTILIGVSNADKALRVHNCLNGDVICKAGGHSEGVTSLTILENESEVDGCRNMRIATTSLDGTIMFWKLQYHNDPDKVDIRGSTSPQDARPNPLRKILSKSQLAGFVAALEPGEWSPLPSPTREYPSLRKSSPDRLRRRTSLANLLRDSPTPVLSPMPRLGRELSPIITSPSTTRPKISSAKTDPPVAGQKDILSAAENLVNTLREFRTSLRRVPDDLDSGTYHELKLELEMTLDVLTKRGQTMDDSLQDASYFSAVNGMQSMSIVEE